MKQILLIILLLLYFLVLIIGSLPKENRNTIRKRYEPKFKHSLNKNYFDDNDNNRLSSSLASSSPPPSSSSSSKRKSLIPIIKEYSLAFSLGLGIGLSALVLSTNTVYETASDVSSSVINNKGTITGTIVKVIDGDTYRLRHQPTPFSSNTFKGSMSSHTIVVRSYAIDTPELPKNGQPGQKYATEAKEFAKSRLINKKVRVQCLSKDQYGRLIGRVSFKEDAFMGLVSEEKDISLELLNEGLAVVYRGGGGQYGDIPMKQWNQIEAKAKGIKKGLWKDPSMLLPSEYKKSINANNDINNDNNNKKNKRKEFVGPTGNNNNMIYNDDDKNMVPSKRGIKRWSERQP